MLISCSGRAPMAHLQFCVLSSRSLLPSFPVVLFESLFRNRVARDFARLRGSAVFLMLDYHGATYVAP